MWKLLGQFIIKWCSDKSEVKNFILKNQKYIFAIVALVVGWYFHSYYTIHIQDRTSEVRQIRENSSEYKFINPLILVADGRNIEFEEYASLRLKIDKYINNQKSKGNAREVSFYLRNLNSGEWAGVNETSLYAPASMLKVSLLMAYLKLADRNPSILLKKIHYDIVDNASSQIYKPKYILEPGDYTVEELLRQMITNSDNNALQALDNSRPDEFLKIYEDLSLPDLTQASLDFMSPRAYSRFFRALYNGSYISHLYSEEALGLLSLTNFNEGLVKGTASTTVSHKFGELTEVDAIGGVKERQLHDCGIVYYPGNPYFICVMTRGDNFSKLSTIIADISKITFDYVSENK